VTWARRADGGAPHSGLLGMGTQRIAQTLMPGKATESTQTAT
jgi:hypothetical protein